MILLPIALAALTTPASADPYVVNASISDGVLNMRTDPTSGSHLMVPIPAGSTDFDRFFCRDISGRQWCKGRWAGYTGWVSGRYLSRAPRIADDLDSTTETVLSTQFSSTARDVRSTAPANECDHLAARNDDPDLPKEIIGIEFIADPELAVAVCRQAIQQYPEDRRLMFELGWSLDSQKKYLEAKQWYEKAALFGSTAAIHNIGSLYLSGSGVVQNYEAARKIWEVAAARGSASSLVEIATLYGQWRVDDDQFGKTSLGLTKRALKLGSKEAESEIGRQLEYGVGVDVDYAAAADNFLKGASGSFDEPADPDRSVGKTTALLRAKARCISDLKDPAALKSSFVLADYRSFRFVGGPAGEPSRHSRAVYSELDQTVAVDGKSVTIKCSDRAKCIDYSERGVPKISTIDTSVQTITYYACDATTARKIAEALSFMIAANGGSATTP